MKARVRYAVSALAALGLASCATTDEYAGKDVRIVQDDQYVAVVEKLALHRGVRVEWVHPPDRRIAQPDQ